MKRFFNAAVPLLVAALGAMGLAGCAAEQPSARPNDNVDSARTAAVSTTATPKATMSAADAEKELTQIEREWADALIKGDASATERFAAADAIFVDPMGGVATKAQNVQEIKSGDLKLEAIDVKDMKVMSLDGDAAVVTYRTTTKGKYKGMDISGEDRWIDVFAWRDGKWQVVAAQGTRVAAPPPAPSKTP